MCLAALSLGQSARFPLVLAANRDEFWARPSAAMDWWASPSGGASILSGRDLEAGGTWLGVNGSGRVALLTNVREPGQQRFDAPSRGSLVVDWLESAETTEAFWERHMATPYNGFNLIGGDLASGRWWWGSNRTTRDHMHSLDSGQVYGLSNAALDTPWPKLVTLKKRMAESLALATRQVDAPVEQLVWSLMIALADKAAAPDVALPATGVPLEWERALAPAFIDAPDRHYGTRCSTVIVLERLEAGPVLHAFELTHATGAGHERPDPALSRRAEGGHAAEQLARLEGLKRIDMDMTANFPSATAPT